MCARVCVCVWQVDTLHRATHLTAGYEELSASSLFTSHLDVSTGPPLLHTVVLWFRASEGAAVGLFRLSDRPALTLRVQNRTTWVTRWGKLHIGYRILNSI